MNSEPVSASVRGVRKNFADVVALDDVSLELEAGLMHGLIGPEGAGKTTLMRVMLGLLRPQAGEVTYAAGGRREDFSALRPDVGYLPQRQSLYPDLSVAEHLDFFRELYGLDAEMYRTRRTELLRLTRLAPFAQRPAGQLSGGMYKKLGLMCALLRPPRALFLDEPTNGVDPISRRELWELLYRLADERIMIVVSTPYMDEAQRCARVHLLERGRVVGSGEPRRLLEKEGAADFDELFLRHGQWTA
jgi:ABC-2 type transport system ATP-binding protein